MEYQNFTSLPPEQEQTFVIYERTSSEAGKKAMTLGAICGGVVGVIALLLFFAYDAPVNAHAVPIESDIAEETPAPAPAPKPAVVEPEAVEEAEVAEEPEAAAAEPAATDPAAPAPPAGATKAPPTALIGK